MNARRHLQFPIPNARHHFLNTAILELELEQEHFLQILRPLYGLSESGYLRYQKLQNHHIHDLQMHHLKIDTFFHYILTNSILSGMFETYVGDLLRSENIKFKHIRKPQNENLI